MAPRPAASTNGAREIRSTAAGARNPVIGISKSAFGFIRASAKLVTKDAAREFSPRFVAQPACVSKSTVSTIVRYGPLCGNYQARATVEILKKLFQQNRIVE
jgi:hypothetical protein